ncbi:MAG: threonine/serine dehydratase [Hyphomonadaceae bacterium]
MILPTFADVQAAADRIAHAVRRTPLFRDDALSERLEADIYVKAECLQRFGAFKLRGAFNKLAAMPEDVRANGVLAFSSGNHAIAVSAAAKHFGVSATIVMPADAPRAKMERVKALDGEVVPYDRVTEDREAIGAKIAAERGLPIVKPFDDPYIIAGQGTAGLEIAQEIEPDIVMAPASGGGLATGIALAVKHLHPGAVVYAVEPQGHDDIARSLAAGSIQTNEPGVRSICDALLVDRMGAAPFALARANLAGALTVSDDEVRAAMRHAFTELRLVLEPSGAAALAALMAGRVDARGKTVAIVASGGNVDAAAYAAAIA